MKRLIFALILISGSALSAFSQTETANCPTIVVSGGGVVESGAPMIFTVNITGLTDTSNLKYEWEISNGTIAGDPQAPTITVDTTGLSGNTNITATVKVVGLSVNCANADFETGNVTYRCILPRIFDEFGKLSNNDVLVRIQNLFIELGSNTDAQGYIINNGTDREFTARERQIQSAIKRFELDSSRVTVIDGGANSRGKGIWTRVYIVPKDVEISALVN